MITKKDVVELDDAIDKSFKIFMRYYNKDSVSYKNFLTLRRVRRQMAGFLSLGRFIMFYKFKFFNKMEGVFRFLNFG